MAGRMLAGWRRAPWWGEWVSDPAVNIFSGERRRVWLPRRFYYERLKALSGEDVGADPSAWENWIIAHPNLVWDEKQGRLMVSAKP